MEHPPERVTLSVVIPVYNEAATIATLLARVQAVPFETEIILVDDGSTDGTWDVVQAFADVPTSRWSGTRATRGKGRPCAMDSRGPLTTSSSSRTRTSSTTRVIIPS